MKTPHRDFSRVKGAFIKAAQRVRSKNVTHADIHPDVKFYLEMTRDDFDDMAKQYGIDAVSDYIREMEKLNYEGRK